MPLQPFTDNFEDNSTEAGFQFTFYCDLCSEGYKSQFIESKTYKKGSFLKGLGGFLSTAADLAGQGNIGYGVERGADVLGEKFEGMTPEWQREHEAAFAIAQNEAKGHFHRCPKCRQWVCENDWNEESELCTDDAPREATEVSSARAKKMVEDIEEKAAGTKVFTGEIKSRQTLCPECGKPAGEGKFCNDCGTPLDMAKCSKCGATNSPTSRFCGECGNKLI